MKKLSLQQISWLARLHHGTDFVRGLASLFKVDSLPNRILDSTSKIICGLDHVADLALTRERKAWHTYTRATVLQQGVRAHGRLLITLNEQSRCATHVWQIGEHVVLWDADWHEGCICSVSSMDELAAEVLGHTLAALGRDSRAALGPNGLTMDGEAAPAHMSSKVAELLARLRSELPHGHRSALLYGPAGAGKTAASRQLVEQLADSAMVVSSDMLHGVDTDIFALVCMWRPKAVVFDDIDRGLAKGNEGFILGGISRVRAVVPLVVATANVCDDFSGALLRPGRFDRVLHLDRLDATIALDLMTHVPRSTRERAVSEGLLAAYLHELNMRCKCGADPDTSLNEMVQRQQSAGDGASRVGKPFGLRAVHSSGQNES